ncbi:MAG: hypothetical protein EAX89_12190 [Candidatus Lokiarchaeota archaeon]|nr:hypothetical protein [Candidatus Lokiarchaeota archaeon]
MAEDNFEELEHFLMPYAIGRFEEKSVKGLKGVLKRMITKDFMDYLAWVVRAFVRCICTVEESLHIKEILTIVLAEANLASNAPPFIIKVSDNFLDTFDSIDLKTMMESEVHRWLVYLQESSKLPGKYNRFTGKYVKM